MPQFSLSGATLVAAIVFGAAGSLHCFVMCGPLACAAQLRGGRATLSLAARYHAARLGAYIVVGALAGALGGVVGNQLSLPLASTLPWLLAATLVLSVLDPGGRGWKRLPPLPGIAHFLRWLGPLRARLSPPLQATIVGALTPLLPCGLVYAMIGTALASGSAASGALLLGGFALGAVPALVAAQLQMLWLRALPPMGAIVVQRALPLAAAVLLVYRAVARSTGHPCH